MASAGGGSCGIVASSAAATESGSGVPLAAAVAAAVGAEHLVLTLVTAVALAGLVGGAVAAARRGVRTRRAQLVNVAAAAAIGLGAWLTAAAVAEVFGFRLLLGLALVGAGAAAFAVRARARVDADGLIEVLGLPRKPLLEDTLLQSLQEDNMVKSLAHFAKTYLPFVIVGKHDQALTARVLRMMPPHVREQLTRQGMVHFLPLGARRLMLGARQTPTGDGGGGDAADNGDSAGQGGTHCDAEGASTTRNVTADTTSGADSVQDGDGMAVGGGGGDGAAMPEGDGAAAAAAAAAQFGEAGNAVGGAAAAARPEVDVLRFIVQEKWRRATAPLASAALGKVQVALLAAAAVQLVLSGRLRRRLWDLAVRFGFLGTLVGLGGSFVLARLVDAGHGTAHADAVRQAARDGVARVLQLPPLARMAATMLVFYVFRRVVLRR